MNRMIIVNDETDYGITIKEWLTVYKGYLCNKAIDFLQQFNEDTVIESSIYDLNCWVMDNIK